MCHLLFLSINTKILCTEKHPKHASASCKLFLKRKGANQKLCYCSDKCERGDTGTYAVHTKLRNDPYQNKWVIFLRFHEKQEKYDANMMHW